MIIPEHDSDRGCLEDTIACVAHSNHRDYEFLLSNSWGIAIHNRKIHWRRKLGGGIQAQTEAFNLLEKYHGITVRQLTKRFHTLIRTVNTMEGYPCLFMDSFWCPWDKRYQKSHNFGHALLVERYDSDQGVFYCTDAFYNIKNGCIDQQSMKKGFLSLDAICVQDVFETPSQDTARDLIVKRMCEVISRVDQLGFLAKQVCHMNPKKEIGQTKNLWHTPLLSNLYGMELDRAKYLLFLRYVQKRYSFPLIQEYICALTDIRDSWGILRNKMVKYLSEYEDGWPDTKTLKDIANDLDRIHTAERKTAAYILGTI